MTDDNKTPLQEVEAPAIEPEVQAPVPVDPMQLILQGLIEMQWQTNKTLEKVVEKLDVIAVGQVENSWSPKKEEDLIRDLNSKKTRVHKSYKVLVIKRVLPMASWDQALHWDMFSNWGIERGDTNKWFNTKAEADAYGNEIAPGKYKLMPVSSPLSEWVEPWQKSHNVNM